MTYDKPVDPRIQNPKVGRGIKCEPEKSKDSSPVKDQEAKNRLTPKDKKPVEKEKPYVPPPPYKPPIPYSQRLAKSKIDSQFKKFAQMLETLHINIPFT